jgi:hypothetical protein
VIRELPAPPAGYVSAIWTGTVSYIAPQRC